MRQSYALFYLLFVFAFAPASATPLPQCEGQDVSKWSDCSGFSLDGKGGFYAGEWKAGQREGRGIQVDESGTQVISHYVKGNSVLPKLAKTIGGESLGLGISRSIKKLDVGVFVGNDGKSSPLFEGITKNGMPASGVISDPVLVKEAWRNFGEALSLAKSVVADYGPLRDSGEAYVKSLKQINSAPVAQSASNESTPALQAAVTQESRPQAAPAAENSQSASTVAITLAVIFLIALAIFVFPAVLGVNTFRKKHGVAMPWPLALLFSGFVVGPLLSLGVLYNVQKDLAAALGADVFASQIQSAVNFLYVVALGAAVLGWVAARLILQRDSGDTPKKLVIYLWLCGPVHALISGAILSGVLSALVPERNIDVHWVMKGIWVFIATIGWSFYLRGSAKIRELYAVEMPNAAEAVEADKPLEIQQVVTQEPVTPSDVISLPAVEDSATLVGHSAVHASPVSEGEVYEMIAAEIDNEALHRATWTKAFAEADGDHDRAKARYIKLRFADLYRAPSAQAAGS